MTNLAERHRYGEAGRFFCGNHPVVKLCEHIDIGGRRCRTRCEERHTRQHTLQKHPSSPPCVMPDRMACSGIRRSEEHTSELQSLMRISYAVFCLKKKQKKTIHTKHTHSLTEQNLIV